MLCFDLLHLGDDLRRGIFFREQFLIRDKTELGVRGQKGQDTSVLHGAADEFGAVAHVIDVVAGDTRGGGEADASAM